MIKFGIILSTPYPDNSFIIPLKHSCAVFLTSLSLLAIIALIESNISTKYGSYNFFIVSKNILIIYIAFCLSFILDFLAIFVFIISSNFFSLYDDIPKHLINPDKEYISPKLINVSLVLVIFSIISSNILELFSGISAARYSIFFEKRMKTSLLSNF